MSLKRTGIIAILLVVMIAMTTASTVAGSYDRNKARDYALKYAENPNPAYRYFEYDCTNFVSQALFTGGWTEVGKYAYYSDDAWYYDGGTRPWYSNSWAVADSLYRYLGRHPERATPMSVMFKKPWNSYFEVGDIIQIDEFDSAGNWGSDGRIDHSMIVTEVNDNDMFVSYHTTNTKRKSLNALISELKAKSSKVGFIGWHIKS